MANVAAKILINGRSNTGKSTLLKSLKNALVFSRDDKDFPFPLPHWNVTDFQNVEHLKQMCDAKIRQYKEKYGHLPEVVVFDTVSKMYLDMHRNCMRTEKGYDVYQKLLDETLNQVDYFNELVQFGMFVVIVCHLSSGKNGEQVEPIHGNFEQRGGYIATVDHTILTTVNGKTRTVTLKDHDRARTTLEDVPSAVNANDFNLQDYIDKIKNVQNSVSDFSL